MAVLGFKIPKLGKRQENWGQHGRTVRFPWFFNYLPTLKFHNLTPFWEWTRAEPLRLHPANPHYFLFRGRPTILITSGEHYGAVLNRNFNYVRYLDELHRCGLNLTRTFSACYRELPGSFGITDN